MDNSILPKGTKLHNRYIIEEVIGQGGFGITYSAFDLLLNSLVAIKEFYIEKYMSRDVKASFDVVFSKDEKELEKISLCIEHFEREIKIMEVLQNVPYVSRIRDHFKENETEYIVMKLLTGCSLESYAKRNGGTIKVSELVPPLEHVFKALEEMHSLGFLHRDLSPGNLFYTEDGDLYLIDFGTATSIEETSDLRNTQIFEHKGFQAPEFKEINSQGPWTDIYSLCATIVYLVTGEGVPAPEDRQILDEIPQLLLRQSLSNKQQNILIQGLNLDINRRCQSISNLRTGLLGEMEIIYSETEVTYCASTEIGSRPINQDNLLVDGLFYFEGVDFIREGIIHCDAKELHLVAVCDGVSGANSGELASRAVAQALNHFLNQYRNSDVLPERLLPELLDQINEKIITLGNKIGKTGTTLSLLLWKNNQFYAINIGDSPIFLLRKRKLELISEPHTLSNKKIMEGLPISLQDRHVIVNYLGKRNVAGSQIAAYRHGYLKKGDTFLICSDGITDKLDRDRLKHYLLKPAVKAMKTIKSVMSKKENRDNCTAIILKF